MKRLALLLSLSILATPSLAAEAALLQPQSGARGLALEVSESRAWLLRPNGQRLRLPLRRGELIEDLVEYDTGWVAAGGRVLGQRRELAVIVDDAAGIERLQPIPEQTGDLRVRPVPLASAEAFTGLAWLEGDSPAEYEIRAAEWTGAGWGPPEIVSAARRGGQAGLAGVVLDDGRWLLVWTASDGLTSALHWAVRTGGRWSTPRRLTAPGRTPDVSPSLLRVPGGALLVWAQRQATGYGLQTVGFADGWSAPRRLGTAAGWAPRFAELAEVGRFLLHRSPTGWVAVELTADGRELRRVEIEDPHRERPVLSQSTRGLELRWQRSGPARQLSWGGSR